VTINNNTSNANSNIMHKCHYV